MMRRNDARCADCPVAPGLPCYQREDFCTRAARPGEDAFRAMLARHAEVRAAAATATAGELSEAELLILECDFRVATACGCSALEYCAQARGSGDDPFAVSLADCRRCVTT